MNYTRYMSAAAIINTVGYTERAKKLAKLFSAEDYGGINKNAALLKEHIPLLRGKIKPLKDLYRSMLYCFSAMGRFISPSLKAAVMTGGVQYMTADPLTEYTDAASIAANTTILLPVQDAADLALRIEKAGMLLPENTRIFCGDIANENIVGAVKSSFFYNDGLPAYINLGFVPVYKSKAEFVAILGNLRHSMTSRDNLSFAFLSYCPVHPGSSFAVTEYSFREMERILSGAGFNIYEEVAFTEKLSGSCLHFILRVKSIRL